jgi:ribosomal protein L11 methyltransferase
MCIDWEAQWRQFAPCFKEGKAHIDLSPFGILKLVPGPGFGDLSHPTTRLVLDLLRSHVKEKDFLDIGCGSGILSLAALMMGARFSYAIDIDRDALLHAHKNAILNTLENRIFLSLHLPKKHFNFPVIAMNMIFSEQKIAWNSLSHLNKRNMIIITSGILNSERKMYLQWSENNQWKLLEEHNESEWKAFVFTT